MSMLYRSFVTIWPFFLGSGTDNVVAVCIRLKAAAASANESRCPAAHGSSGLSRVGALRLASAENALTAHEAFFCA